MFSLVLVVGLVGVNPSEDSAEARAAAPLVQKETPLTQRWIRSVVNGQASSGRIITAADARRVLAVPQIMAWIDAEAVRRYDRRIDDEIKSLERYEAAEQKPAGRVRPARVR